MLRFIDSFNHYQTADILRKWTNVPPVYQDMLPGGATLNTFLTIDNAGGRRGGGIKIAVGWDGVSSFFGGPFAMGLNVMKTLDSQSTWIIGFAYKVSILPYTHFNIVSLTDIGIQQLVVVLNLDGTVQIKCGNTVLATSSSPLSTGNWQYLEFKATIGTSGSVELRKNGRTIASASGVVTKTTANNSANAIVLGLQTGSTGGPAVNVFYDDVYVCDGTGTTNNNFLGDCSIDVYLPSGNGTHSDFLGSDGNSIDNYLLVNQTYPDDDTTYVHSDVLNAQDTYIIPDMPFTPTAIYGIQSNFIAKKNDAGPREISTAIRLSGVDYVGGGSQVLSTTYNNVMSIIELCPATSAAWNIAEFNAAEFGVKITV